MGYDWLPLDQNPGIPQPGTVLVGKYRVERALGEGGMAVVLEATHLALGQRVAVKLLRGNAARSQEVVARFLREAQIAAQLPPEHIARVTDVGQSQDGTPYLVMELLVGRDLAHELHARGPLPIVEAVDLVLQACEGVAEAHAVGLVHRDLKPANLFLTRRRDGAPVVKVLDFGLSKAAVDKASHALTQTTSNFGTPQYMSPEQIQSAKHVDARSDQHALAMVLFELLTASPPFEADTVTALAVIIATKPPPMASELRPEVPHGLSAALARAMAKRPEDRFPDLAGFAAAIGPYGGVNAGPQASAIAAILAAVPQSRSAAAPDAATATAPAELAARAAAPSAIAMFPARAADPARPVLRSPATHAPLTSSWLDLRRKPRSKMLLLGVGAAVAVVWLAVAVVVLVRGGKAAPAGEVQPVTSPTELPAVLPAAPVESAAPPASASGAPSASASAAAPPPATASAATTATTATPPPRRPPARTPRRTDPGASEVFGGKRK